MSSPYDNVSKTRLKFKNTSGIKKKKKSKDLSKVVEHISTAATTEEQREQKPEPLYKEVHRTKAEKAFLKMQEKRQIERIMEKASKTHKQRVEEFNRHLDSLTEHYDIPKVSWTK
uniref:Putative conserved alpha-helical protein n=1 Tax=Ixodes ricinus TaxID=34613 RepID=A0A131XYY9_IXORI